MQSVAAVAEYQDNFSALYPGAAADAAGRRRKAATIRAVLADHFGDRPLSALRLLDVGASTGIIDACLAEAFAEVVGVDIDRDAIARAAQLHQRPNLRFAVGNGLALAFPDASFDVVLCAHVYEHVPDPHRLLAEIRRVLRPGGVCYFAAGNRFQPMEPHYRLPLLSVVPKAVAHLYLRALARGDHYYETHLSYWQLRRLVADFAVHDYTARLIEQPQRFEMGYLLPPGSAKAALGRFVVRVAYPFIPTYIWLLERPASG